MRTIDLSLTRQEYEAMLNLLDLGVKAGGLKVATVAAVILQKCAAADAMAMAPMSAKPNGQAAQPESQESRVS